MSDVRMLDGHRLELGEGPGYDPATDLAWWFDIEGKRLYTRRIGAGDTECHDLPLAASALAVTADGRHLLLTERGLYFRDLVTGALTLHLAVEADNPVTRSNDARVHPSGAFWFGTMGWKSQPGAGSIYRYFRGQLERLWGGITIPNAICFSPDGTTAYFTDTPTGIVRRVATDPTTGRPTGEPENFLMGFDGGPDGAVTDAEGNIWIAVFGSGRVFGFTPKGRSLGRFNLPARNVTCPAFVGRDARTMLVTSALHDLSPDERAASPDAGATFVLPIDFAGRFDPPVAL